MRGKAHTVRQTKKAILYAEAKQKGIVIPDGYFTTENLEALVRGTKPGAHAVVRKVETDEERDIRISKRFAIMDQMIEAAISGDIRALIISGPPGLGKSYNVEQALKKHDPKKRIHQIVKGNSSAVGLFKALWDHRHEGNILVFDDCDSIFFDDTALNLLKAACDTCEQRTIDYRSEGTLVSDTDQSRIDRTFEFNGTVIFITNEDFDHKIECGHRSAKHMEALLDRAKYIDLTMKTRRDYLIRIKQVARSPEFLAGYSNEVKKAVIDYIEHNYKTLKSLSVRTAIRIAQDTRVAPKNWKDVSDATEFRAIVGE